VAKCFNLSSLAISFSLLEGSLALLELLTRKDLTFAVIADLNKLTR